MNLDEFSRMVVINDNIYLPFDWSFLMLYNGWPH